MLPSCTFCIGVCDAMYCEYLKTYTIAPWGIYFWFVRMDHVVAQY